MPGAREAQILKNLARFRLVTFDVTDTLLRFKKPPAVQYMETASQLGIGHTDEQSLSSCFRQEFKAMAQKYPNFGCHTPHMTWQDWWTKLVENIFGCANPQITQDDLNKLSTTLIRIYRSSECWENIEGSQELVEKIRNCNKIVGVISNFDPSLKQVLSSMGIEHQFDFVLTSYEAGVLKPNEKIFQIPLERYKVRAEEALHIGNLYEVDYVGARNAGWSSLLIGGGEFSETKRGERGNHIYKDVRELIEALEGTTIQWS